MIHFIEIFIYLMFLLNQSYGIDQGLLLINDPSQNSHPLYSIIPTNDRVKRDQSPWFYPEFDKNQISCGHNVYAKLNTCSQLTECQDLSACLESVHCPMSIKSFGSLILNLLRILGINNCNIDERNETCPNEKRIVILKNLFTHSTKSNDDTYCNTISSFITKIKDETTIQCPLNSKQVEAFMENYLCSTSKNTTIDSTNPMTNVEDILTTSTSTSLSQMAYLDEDDSLKFINSNRKPLNNSDQHVYINDHQYYNVSYIIPKSQGIPLYFVEDNSKFTPIHALADRHRSAFGINLKFGFPFYGHTINRILVATGENHIRKCFLSGFIYTGDLLHSALIGSTQYIAPFMANFDLSIGKNETKIKYYDNGTHFICTWKNIYIQDQQEAGPFTFQAILQNTGNIYFNYLQIPNVKISSLNHAHRLGLSDAYLSQHSTHEHVVRVITLYDKINLKKENIQNGVSIVFYMDQTCNTFTDCSSCLANRGKRYNCSWCDDIQKCSDGYDRSRQQWIRAQCHRLASEDTCSNSLEDTYDHPRFLSSSFSSRIHSEKRNEPSLSSSRQNSAFQIFRTILLTLLLSVLILSLLTLAVTYIYAYRHPTSPAGMWLLEHRPSTYIARFKRFTGSN